MRPVKSSAFAGYGDFQEALLADVDDLRSPRTLLAERRERMGPRRHLGATSTRLARRPATDPRPDPPR